MSHADCATHPCVDPLCDHASVHRDRLLKELVDGPPRPTPRRPPPHHMPGTVVSRVLYGSYAHGTETVDSDEDFRGVFQLPNDAFLGLHDPKTTHEEPPDQVYHELGHYMRLLLKGNPNIVGMLWAPPDVVVERTPIWDDLCEHAEMWLTRAMASAYRGWLFGEMSRPNLGAKRLSHVPRLAYELEGAVKHRSIAVRLTGWKRDFVMDVKEGRMGIEPVRIEVERIMEEIEPELDRMPPPPTEATNDLLLEYRRG